MKMIYSINWIKLTFPLDIRSLSELRSLFLFSTQISNSDQIRYFPDPEPKTLSETLFDVIPRNDEQL